MYGRCSTPDNNCICYPTNNADITPITITLPSWSKPLYLRNRLVDKRERINYKYVIILLCVVCVVGMLASCFGVFFIALFYEDLKVSREALLKRYPAGSDHWSVKYTHDVIDVAHSVLTNVIEFVVTVSLLSIAVFPRP